MLLRPLIAVVVALVLGVAYASAGTGQEQGLFVQCVNCGDGASSAGGAYSVRSQASANCGGGYAVRVRSQASANCGGSYSRDARGPIRRLLFPRR